MPKPTPKATSPKTSRSQSKTLPEKTPKAPVLWQTLSADAEFCDLVHQGLSAYKLHAHLMARGIRCGATVVKKARDFVRTVARNAQLPSLPPEKVEDNVEGEHRNITLDKTTVCTEEQLVERCQIDLTRWEITHCRFKAYQGYAKDSNDEIQTVQLYSVSASFRKIPGAALARAVMDEFLLDARDHAPIYTARHHSLPHDEHLLELALFDAHVGKLCWGEETGQDYDLNRARDAFLDSVEHLLALAQGFPVARIVLPLGNDFYNSEGLRGTTTRGTPQQDDSRWQKSFTMGRRLVVETIDRLGAIAPVDVVMVPGNHDHERIYHLGEVLQAWYRNCAFVAVDNSPRPRKYYAWEKNLVMFTHGNEENPRDLPAIMATEEPLLWCNSVFREVHTGHFHKKKEVRYTGMDEHMGVRHRTLPSISGRDAWHASKGYLSQRAAEALVFHPSRGPVGNFSHNLLPIVPLNSGACP